MEQAAHQPEQRRQRALRDPRCARAAPAARVPTHIMAASMREGLAVVRAAGIRTARVGRMIPSVAPFVLSLPDAVFFRIAATMVKIDPQARSSMLDDLMQKRVTEIDFLNGEIVRLGDKYGVPTPVNRAIIALVKDAEAKRQGVSDDRRLTPPCAGLSARAFRSRLTRPLKLQPHRTCGWSSRRSRSRTPSRRRAARRS